MSDLYILKIKRCLSITNFKPTKFNTGYSLQQNIRCELYKLGKELGFKSIAECKTNFEKGFEKCRIDLCWLDQENILFAFEIEKGLSGHSIAKLQQCEAKYKMIISTSKKKRTLYKNLIFMPKDIIHIPLLNLKKGRNF